MTIKELLLSDIFDVRVSHGNRWLFGSENGFAVYEHPYRARNTKLLYSGQDEAKAVKALINEE